VAVFFPRPHLCFTYSGTFFAIVEYKLLGCSNTVHIVWDKEEFTYMNNKALVFALAGFLALMTSPSWALSVSEMAPDFTLTDSDGVTHTLSDYRGKVVFLNFMGAT
jgi:AhpC/TSA family